MNNNDGVYVDGQGVEVPAAPVSLGTANEELQKIGVSETSGYTSNQIKNMLSDPGFRSGDAFVTEQEIVKRYNVAKDPYWTTYSGRTRFDELKLKSGADTIIKDELAKFAINFQTLGDKAQMALGGITALATGNAIGAEMRDRAYDSIESATRRMNLENTNAADAETLTAQITQGAASMLEMVATGLMTGGIAPLAQMGVEAMGDGTYNNMIKYAAEHDGSIEGYEGNWLETGIDLVNAAAQVAIERWKGVGSMKFLTGTRGHWLKETVNGFVQEGSQDFLTDLAEYLKGNDDAPTNWERYAMSGLIGGFLQGALGAAIHKYSRTQADAEMANLIFRAKKNRNPDLDEAKAYQESRKEAVAFNDEVEAGLVKNTWDELANRIDANNDRGKIRDNLVAEFTKARMAALGLESADELDPEDIADIQDAATVATGEAFRESFIKGISIFDTMTARLTADGKDLVVRDLQPGEKGIAEKETVDLLSEQEKLAQEMGAERERRATQKLQDQVNLQQQEAVAEKQLRTAQLKQIEDWATEQVKLGEDIGARREKRQKSLETQKRKAEQVKERRAEVARIKKAKDIRKDVIKKLKKDGIEAEDRNDISKHQAAYITLKAPGKDNQVIRIGWGQIQNGHKDNVIGNFNAAGMSTDEIVAKIKELLALEKAPNQKTRLKGGRFANVNFGFRENTGNVALQQSLKNIAEGKIEDAGRGAYDPRYQRIILNKDSDVSTILHELSHMWLNNWFKAYRSENTPESFKKWWRPVEKALGIRESDRFLDSNASEKFARAFEKWVLEGGKGAEASLNPVFERLSTRLADIYDDLATRYFDMVGDLKPEVQSWFAKNEELADSIVVDVPKEEGEPEKVRVKYRDRVAERQEAQKTAEREEKITNETERAAATLNDALEETYPNLMPIETQREHDTSRKVRERLSAQGIIDGYRNMYDQEATLEVAEKVRDYVAMAPDEAFEVAMGRKNAPEGLPATMVYTAVVNDLDARGDVVRLWELQQSPIVEYRANIARELQRGRDFFRDGNNRADIPRIVKYLNKAYENKMSEQDKAMLAKEVNTINELIEKNDLNFEDAWNNILSDMECK